jgi:superfamily II DNA or RNA helicase
MIKVKSQFVKVWNLIKDHFDENFLEESKLNKQLEIFHNFGLNKGRGYVEAVTGFGKTIIAIIAILKLNKTNPLGTINVVVPTISLKEDWEDVEDGYITRYRLKNVKVYVVNSYTSYDRKWVCDFLILDEAHRFTNDSSENFSKVLDNTEYKFILALSATLAKKEKDFLEERDINRIGLVTLDEAEKNNWISNFTIFNIPVQLNFEDLEEKERLDNIHNNYFKKFSYDFHLAMGCSSGVKGYKHPDLGWRTGNSWRLKVAKEFGWNENLGKEHKYSPTNIAKMANSWKYAMNSRRDFLHKAVGKLELTEQILNKFQLKTIVFTQHTITCDKLKQRLGDISECYHSSITSRIYKDSSLETIIANSEKVNNKTFYKTLKGEYLTLDQIKKLYPTYVKLGEKRLKSKIKEDFKNNKFSIILAANSLNEGFDCEDILIGVIHSGSSVKRVNVQQMGRVLRTYNNKHAIIINIYVRDSQDEKWVKSRQSGTPKSKIKWIDSIDEIILKEEEDLILT